MAFYPNLHDPDKLCSETRITEIGRKLRSASPLQTWRSFPEFQVRSWSDSMRSPEPLSTVTYYYSTRLVDLSISRHSIICGEH